MVYTRTLDQRPYIEVSRSAPLAIDRAGSRIIESLEAARRPPRGTIVPLYLRVTRTLHRARDVARIYRRTLDLRQELLELDKVCRADAASELTVRRDDVAEEVRTAFECLYLFGNVALDEWACLTAYVFGWPQPLETTFDRFRAMADGDGLPEEFRPFASDLLWLITQVRFYRNKFIVHVKRPWSIGHTRSTYEYDFQLSSTALPASYDDAEMLEQVTSLARRVGIRLEDAPARMLLPILVDMLGEVSSTKIREEIRACYLRYGTLTPTFHEVGRNILEFLETGTEILAAQAIRHPETAEMA